MRSVSHALIGELSKIHKGDSLIKDTIIAASIRVDDLTEIVSYVKTPLSKQIKRGVRNALLKFNRYQLSKYKSEGKEYSLVDVFNLTHPKVKHANEEQKKAWEDLIKGELKSFDTWETEISNCKPEEKKTKWEELVLNDKLGYMALLRNLNNLISNKVSNEVIDKAAAKLSDKDEVSKSRQLPFRFVTAYDNVKGNRILTDAISDAMDAAVSNTPELSGRTLIAVDTSGSMEGDPLKKASIFAATLAKSNSKSDVILYSDSLKEMTISGKTPIIDISKSIENSAIASGTQTSLVFAYAMKKVLEDVHYSRIIIISDNESWNEYSVQEAYKVYLKQTNEDPFVYAIDIQGYGTKDVTGSKVFHLCGWSEKILDFIGKIEEGESLVEYVKNFNVSKKELEEDREYELSN
jgi:hypothetical protein